MRQILLFCVGGSIGFLIDAGLVQWLVSAFAANPYAARLLVRRGDGHLVVQPTLHVQGPAPLPAISANGRATCSR
jgi:hypothetical protein